MCGSLIWNHLRVAKQEPKIKSTMLSINCVTQVYPERKIHLEWVRCQRYSVRSAKLALKVKVQFFKLKYIFWNIYLRFSLHESPEDRTFSSVTPPTEIFSV